MTPVKNRAERGDSFNVNERRERIADPSRAGDARGRTVAAILASNGVYQRTEGKTAAPPDSGRRSCSLSGRSKSAGATCVALLASRHLPGVRPPGRWRFALLLPWLALRCRRTGLGNAR